MRAITVSKIKTSDGMEFDAEMRLDAYAHQKNLNRVQRIEDLLSTGPAMTACGDVNFKEVCQYISAHRKAFRKAMR